MAGIKTETTVAEELRTAAAKLREAVAAVPAGHWTLHEDLIEHDGSSESAILTDARPGMDALVLSGEWWGEGLAVMRLLVALHVAAEPLASWLESAAWVAGEHPQDPDYAGLPDTRFCNTCQDEETTCVAFVAGALAVARAINGGDRG